MDALSDDGQRGITIIAMLGNVFSPYYALARRRDQGDPIHHCALNVALYGPDRRAWAMTERGRNRVTRSRDALVIGPSALHWDGDALTIEINEFSAPIPQPVRGVVRVWPQTPTGRRFALDANGRHHWWPISPAARVEVAFTHPALNWSGHGYLDSNGGTEPLEAAFRDWDWSRMRLREGSAVLYDVQRKDDTRLALGLRFDGQGQVEPFEPAPRVILPRCRWWRMPRAIQSEDPATTRVLETLEDTPFYARSTVAARVRGEPVTAFHESLSLTRFDRLIVQAMLPFRMPRLAG